jgi:hypothetical protein
MGDIKESGMSDKSARTVATSRTSLIKCICALATGGKQRTTMKKARTLSTADSIQADIRVNVVNAIMMRSHQLDKPQFVIGTAKL